MDNDFYYFTNIEVAEWGGMIAKSHGVRIMS